jgi:hypothetical protein
MHSVILTSSLTVTSSASTLKPSIRAQFPILHFHEMIEFSINVPSPILVSPINVQFLSLQPLPILHFGPITTLGPIEQFSPI